MTLVVDASALVAIGLREPEAVAFSQALLKDDDCLAAPINLVEAGIVLSGRWLNSLKIDIVHGCAS